MRRTIALILASTVATGAALAQEAMEETVEELASEEEAQAVMDSIARIGCEAEQVEKESDDLFEIDDATCEIGQYDIKLDGAYDIVSMTKDF